MVSVAGPVDAELPALSVKVLVLAVLAWLKDAVAPLGRPEAARLTLPVKPAVGLTVIVVGTLLPCATLKVLGAVARL
jgi:hypothetical protein